MCQICCTIVNSTHKDQEHVSINYIGLVKFTKCQVEFEDVLAMKHHKKDCSYSCEVPGCCLKHLTALSSVIHYRKYCKSIK